MLTITPEDPHAADAHALMEALSATLAAITGDSGKASFDANDVCGSSARFVLARDENRDAVGCGAFRPLQPGICELKRMYSCPGTSGVGSAVLAFLEAEAARLGYSAIWLETRLVNERAVRFYEKRGYSRIANYGKYAGNAKAVCFEKRLTLSGS